MTGRPPTVPASAWGRCHDDVSAAPCRACGNDGMASVVCLGSVALANEFVPIEVAPSPRFPLHVMHCSRCCLAQLARGVPPERLFRQYAYFSSASAPVIRHGEELANFVQRRLAPARDGLILDVGGNDGHLLKVYAARGHRVLGIDPARNVAAQARADGIPMVEEFLSAAVAEQIRSQYGPSAVVHASNVLAHMPEIRAVMTAFRTLLDDGDGVLVVEVPYLLDLLRRGLFDTIYHEHVFYYSVTALQKLFATADLTIEHVEPTNAQGGSLRLLVRAGDRSADPSVATYLAAEQRAGINEPRLYAGFAELTTRFLAEIREHLAASAAAGLRLAGFSAPAKASVMISATDAPLQYICDSTPYKLGRALPGTTIPIVPPARLLADQPDQCVILAWNYADVIVAQNEEYLRRGGTFLKIVDFAVQPVTWRSRVPDGRVTFGANRGA
jgi:SAM-dependent methyltransferase